ncbi:response regulator transcription factor [Aestuariibius insulae]|uniref:response regulator transcription factor n=1 Tax=Aestuariibius insulae TaxID=2058287 RepID=UPI00345E5978
MDDLNDFMIHRPPTRERPLLGVTILVVEDSRFACEALRLLSIRSGARIRRADSLSSAQRHLKVYRPTVAIIDEGLPDGSGASLIASLHAEAARIPVILGSSGDEAARASAIEAGADGFIAKPIARLAEFQQAILEHLPDAFCPPGPRLLGEEEIIPDPIAMSDDMAHAANLLSTRCDPETIAYLRQFLDSIAQSAQDRPMGDALADLAAARRQGLSEMGAVEALSHVVQSKLSDSKVI